MKGEIPDTIFSAAKSWLSYPLRNLRQLHRLDTRSAKDQPDVIWSLRDVSFDVHPGDVIGIIGRNGAGKSTLLKILSRITQPTSGSAVIHGNVASLLEVGTGFHPELTGRENIYLNGTILGMKKREIDQKFDQIAGFSGVEKFLDTPIKRYSSGMKVRLAFSVAAHLDPEVLIIDEVLAVGDADFQKKCLGKMHDVSGSGRTVLFVSHNMAAVSSLCNRCVFLDQGKVQSEGETSQVINRYLASGTEVGPEWNSKSEQRQKCLDRSSDSVKLRSVRVVNSQNELAYSTDIEESVTIEVEFESLDRCGDLLPKLTFTNGSGAIAFVTHDVETGEAGVCNQPGIYRSQVLIPENLLAEGDYFVTAAIVSYHPDVAHVRARDCVSFSVIDHKRGSSVRGSYHGPFPGAIRPQLPWTTSRCKSNIAVS